MFQHKVDQMTNKLLIFVARFIRYFKFPHIFKYAFFLIIRRKQIKVNSVINFSGAKIELNLGEFIGYWIFMEGSYEESWIKIIAKLTKDKVFIDIGANIGIYSLSLFKEARQIYAFEPENETYNRLVNNLKINNIRNIKTYKKAVTEKDVSNLTLYINRENMGLSSLKIHYAEGKQLIQATNLDSFIKENRIKNIGVVKIDVEGSELDVLLGASHTLNRIGPPILIELNGLILGPMHRSPRDIYKALTKYRYRPFQLRDDLLSPLKVSELSMDMNCNILFVKDEK